MARRFGIGLATVQLWVGRAGHERLDRVDWSARSSARHHVVRTPPELEDRILELRQELREQSILGEYGAAAIRRELLQRDPFGPVPALRTVGRILERRGALDGRRRVRRPPPPTGWYLPDVAARRVEVDSFDFIEGLRLQGGLELVILTGISLHGGLAAAWPEQGMTAAKTVVALTEHWRTVGRPGYAQFDNDTRFIGSHGNPDAIGTVVRLCLALGVVPVFAPPREFGFQAGIEAFNGRWQSKLWARFWDPTLAGLQARSAAFIAASRRRAAVRIESAPVRVPLGHDEPADLVVPPNGRLIFLRRTSEEGRVAILGHRIRVHPNWPHRLVRSELDLADQTIRFYALRRRDPTDQPLLAEVPYRPPRRWFERPGRGGTVSDLSPE